MTLLHENFHHGTITNNPLGAAATSISSAAFIDLPAVSGGNTLLLTLDPLGVDGVPEIVEVTAHAASAGTVTVTRGEQTTLNGSAGRIHATGTEWRWTWTAGDAAAKVNLAGDTMTGDLIMSGSTMVKTAGDPVDGNSLTRKTYTDATYVNVSGDTMTGNLFLSATQSGSASAATRRDYVDQVADARVSVAGDTMTGALTVTGGSLSVGAAPATEGHLIQTDGHYTSRHNAPTTGGTPNVTLDRTGTAAVAIGEPFLKVLRGGTTIGRIEVLSASTSQWVGSSDPRLKTKTGDAADASALAQQIGSRVYRGRWIADEGNGGEWMMYNSDDVATVAPYAVTGVADAVDAVGNIDPQGVADAALVPLLFAALSQALDRIDALEAR